MTLFLLLSFVFRALIASINWYNDIPAKKLRNLFSYPVKYSAFVLANERKWMTERKVTLMLLINWWRIFYAIPLINVPRQICFGFFLSSFHSSVQIYFHICLIRKNGTSNVLDRILFTSISFLKDFQSMLNYLGVVQKPRDRKIRKKSHRPPPVTGRDRASPL